MQFASAGLLSLSQRLEDMAILYEQYRVVSLTATAGGSQNGGGPLLAWIPGSCTSFATTAAQLFQSDKLSYMHNRQTTPAKLRLNRADIAGPQNWYETGVAEAADTIGCLYVTEVSPTTHLAVAGNVLVHFEVDLDFRGASAPAVLETKMLRQLSLLPEEERKELSRALTNRVRQNQQVKQVSEDDGVVVPPPILEVGAPLGLSPKPTQKWF